MLMVMAILRGNKKTGIKNVGAIINLAENDEKVACHICFALVPFSDSFEICIPSASENASAKAIVNIPPITTSLEFVEKYNPIINPKVVITPEVNPKLKPD